MSNRQARREQARTTRSTRPTRPAPGGSRRPTSSSGGGGNGIFSPGFMLVLAGFLVVAVLVGVLAVVFGGGDDGDEDLVAALEESTANLPLDLANGTKLGRDDAPVKITAFEDFQCPFCLQYTAEQEGEIVEQLVKTGDVQLEFRHLPILGAESARAATASQCAADQNKFWQYHHKLFLTQAEAGQTENEQLNEGRFSDDKLKQFATDVGLDRAQFDQCFDSNKYLDKVTEDQRTASQFGITGTPGFLVNGQPLGSGTPVDIDAWKQLVTNVKNAQATATANASASPSATTPAASATTPAGTTTPAASGTPAATRTP